jgi:hypothetical protein
MNAASTRRNWPSGRGFERWYGFLGAETNQWHPDLVCGAGPRHYRILVNIYSMRMAAVFTLTTVKQSARLAAEPAPPLRPPR